MIKQTDFYFKIRDYGIYVTVIAINIYGEIPVDKSITYFFPQLLEIGLKEPSNGRLYCRDYNSYNLKTVLINMGFITEGDRKHKRIISGKKVKEKIIPMNTLQEEIKMLEEELKFSIEEEDYETSSMIRDELEKLKND